LIQSLFCFFTARFARDTEGTETFFGFFYRLRRYALPAEGLAILLILLILSEKIFMWNEFDFDSFFATDAHRMTQTGKKLIG
jgi:hypothetical protein